MKKALVTGSEGFIGSHLLERLVRENYNVKALVLYNSFNNYGWIENLSPEIRKNIEIVMGDVRDESFLHNITQNVDIIFHLAALIAIPYSYIAPRQYIDTNVTGTLNVLQVALQRSIPVIHTSTSEVYGSAQYVPIDEKHPLNAQSPYAASKIAADQLALSFHRSFQLPVSIIRPFNTFGPRQSNRAVIPTLITQFLGKNDEIKVGNLTTTRDFTYVEDTVDGFIQMHKHHDKAIGEVINLGTGFEVSIQDLISILEELTNKKLKVVTEIQRLRPEKSEVNRLLSNPNLAENLIDWKAKTNNIQDLKLKINQTINWFEENLQFYKIDGYHV
jgi:NAD dependent epimerase/dehydratase